MSKSSWILQKSQKKNSKQSLSQTFTHNTRQPGHTKTTSQCKSNSQLSQLSPGMHCHQPCLLSTCRKSSRLMRRQQCCGHCSNVRLVLVYHFKEYAKGNQSSASKFDTITPYFSYCVECYTWNRLVALVLKTFLLFLISFFAKCSSLFFIPMCMRLNIKNRFFLL